MSIFFLIPENTVEVSLTFLSQLKAHKIRNRQRAGTAHLGPVPVLAEQAVGSEHLLDHLYKKTPTDARQALL